MTSETKWTPGPWVQRPRGSLMVCGSDDRHIANVWHEPGGKDDRSQHDAPLIASAPELYACLDAAAADLARIVSAYRETDPVHAELTETITAARAALARARGEAQ